MQKIKWKKNLFGYLLWMLLCCIVCCIFATTGTEILAGVGIERTGASIAVMCIFAVAEIHLFFRIYTACAAGGHVPSGRGERGRSICAVVLLIAVRIGAAALCGLEPVDKALFEAAEVTGKNVLPSAAHKASFAYSCFLSLLFRFFGNRWDIVVAMQLLMQTGAALLFYGAARRLTGRAGALGFLILAAVSPGLMLHYRAVSPDLLLSVLLGVILLTAGALCLAVDEGKRGRLAALGLFTGVLTGACAWLDLWGVVALLAVLTGILQLDRQGRPAKGIAVFTLLLGFWGAFLAALGMESAVFKAGFFDVLRQYIAPYTADIRLTAPPPLYGLELTGVFFVNLLAGMAVIGFFYQNYERTAVVTILLAGSLVFRIFNMTQVSYTNLWNFLLLLAAGSGIQCFYDRKYGEKEPDARQGVSAGTAEEVKEGREETMKKNENDRPENNGGEQEVKYIPNPLPLPKRHVKKEIAFDYEPGLSQMKFDRELKPGEDDFDI